MQLKKGSVATMYGATEKYLVAAIMQLDKFQCQQLRSPRKFQLHLEQHKSLRRIKELVEVYANSHLTRISNPGTYVQGGSDLLIGLGYKFRYNLVLFAANRADF